MNKIEFWIEGWDGPVHECVLTTVPMKDDTIFLEIPYIDDRKYRVKSRDFNINLGLIVVWLRKIK